MPKSPRRRTGSPKEQVTAAVAGQEAGHRTVHPMSAIGRDPEQPDTLRPSREGMCETLVERQIREAMEEGAFDDLPHQGKRLPLELGGRVEPAAGSSWRRCCRSVAASALTRSIARSAASTIRARSSRPRSWLRALAASDLPPRAACSNRSEEDSAAGEWALAQRVLRNAGAAPPWIELAAEQLLDPVDQAGAGLAGLGRGIADRVGGTTGPASRA